MPRPRKNPADPKWQNVGISEQVPTDRPDEWKLYFSSAMCGLISRGGMSAENIIKTSIQYADDALRATNGRPDNV